MVVGSAARRVGDVLQSALDWCFVAFAEVGDPVCGLRCLAAGLVAGRSASEPNGLLATPTRGGAAAPATAERSSAGVNAEFSGSNSQFHRFQLDNRVIAAPVPSGDCDDVHGVV